MFPQPLRLRPPNARVREAQSRGIAAVASVDRAFLAGSFVDDVLDEVDRWRRAARRVHLPTLLVRGQRSSAVGPDELSKFAEDMPQAEVIAIDAGHLIARDQPDELAQLLTAFLLQFRKTSA